MIESIAAQESRFLSRPIAESHKSLRKILSKLKPQGQTARWFANLSPRWLERDRSFVSLCLIDPEIQRWIEFGDIFTFNRAMLHLTVVHIRRVNPKG